MTKARSETPATYTVSPCQKPLTDDEIIEWALRILEQRLPKAGPTLSSPLDVRNYLTLHLAGREHEVFGCVWLNASHDVIEVQDLFRGTVTQTSVFPRELVKEGLRRNAAAVILYHNHPTGNTEPSMADEALTRTLKESMGLVDIKVLDHFIVAGMTITSFAEKGLI